MQTTHPIKARGERGGVLILALFIMIFAVGVVVSGSMTIRSNKSRTDTSFMLTGQAAEFARSGLTETINWFRRQPGQPVLTFAPQLDGAADPPILDTEDPDIGLVREFRVSGNIYGRYEVWKPWAGDPDTNRMAWRQQLQIEDVSIRRGRGTTGTSWRLKCTGFVFVKRDKTKSFREYPNYVIARETLESEMSRLAFALPGQAAICARNGSAVSIQKNARVDGGSVGAGVYYPNTTGVPVVGIGGSLKGTPPSAPSAYYDDSIRYVFGVSQEGLNSMANLFITDEAAFPAPIQPGSLTILDIPGKAIHFTATRPLDGYGIVLIHGDVIIDPGSNSFFSGLLYVDGNLTVNAPCVMRGAVITTGSFLAQGIGDFVDVVYDDWIINFMQTTMANYRTSRAARRRIQPD